MSRSDVKSDSFPPIPVGEDTPLRMKLRTLLIIIAAVATVVASWLNIKADIADHSKQLVQIQITLASDHEQLQKQGILLMNMDQKLDYLSGARRTRPLAASFP